MGYIGRQFRTRYRKLDQDIIDVYTTGPYNAKFRPLGWSVLEWREWVKAPYLERVGGETTGEALSILEREEELMGGMVYRVLERRRIRYRKVSLDDFDPREARWRMVWAKIL